MAVHATAVVEDGARLGVDVHIGPFCLVGRDVTLGDGVRLLSHVVVNGATRIGDRTTVHSHAVLGGEAQIRNNSMPLATLVIGTDCVIREAVTMNCGSRTGHGSTIVGNSGYFMAYSHVGHDCKVGDDVTFANSATLAGHVEIGQGVILGGLVAVQQFGRIGKGAMIGGVTGVNRDVIPYGMAFGDHVELAGLNLVGLKRRGLKRETINALRGTHRRIFLESGGSLEERARAALERWGDIIEVREIVDFILSEHKQPICLARRRGAGTDVD